MIDEAPIKELPPVDTTLITEEPKEPTQKKIFEELKNWLTKVKIDIEGKKLALFNGYKARLGKLFEKYKLKNALHANIAIAQQQIEQNNNTIDTILTKDTITDEDLHQFEQALRSNQAQYTNIEQAEKGKFTILTEKDFNIRNSVQSTYDHMKQLKNDYNTLEEMLAKEQSKSKPNQNMIDLLEIQHEAKKIELEIAYQGAIILIEQSPATTEANTAEQVQQVA